MPHAAPLATARQRLLRAMRRFEKRRLIESLIVRGPLSEAQEKRGRELAIKHDWEGFLRRLRGSS
jgi:hypothetical protein